MAKKSKKAAVIKVDFTDVEVSKKCPEGDHIIAPLEVTQEKGDAASYLKWKYEVTEGKGKGCILYNNTSLSPKSLWALRTVLEAHGLEVPDGVMKLDLGNIIKDAEPAGCTVDHDTYQGKKQSRITDIFEAGDVGDGEEDDGDGEEEGDEAPTEDEINEMDEDELEEVVDDHDLDIELDDAKGKGKKKLAAQRKMVIEALDSEEEEEEEEEDETYSKKDVKKMDEEALEELIEKHDLDVDLEDHDKLKDKRGAVIDALDDEDLLG